LAVEIIGSGIKTRKGADMTGPNEAHGLRAITLLSNALRPLTFHAGAANKQRIGYKSGLADQPP
jgi:hypothetical protein